MTTVIGFSHDKESILIADDMLTYGYEPMSAPGVKIFESANIAFGVTGTVAMAQTIENIDFKGVVQRARSEGKRDSQIIYAVVRAIQAAFKDADIDAYELGFSALMIFNHRLYRISSDLSSAEITAPYTAIGSGSEYAIGALDALIPDLTAGGNVAAHLERAMTIAAKHDIYTGCTSTMIQHTYE